MKLVSIYDLTGTPEIELARELVENKRVERSFGLEGNRCRVHAWLEGDDVDVCFTKGIRKSYHLSHGDDVRSPENAYYPLMTGISLSAQLLFPEIELTYREL